MDRRARQLVVIAFRVLEVVLIPLTLAGAIWLRFARHLGLHNLPITRALTFGAGLLPVRHHYYEPFVREGDLAHALDQVRDLPGIDLNLDEQVMILESFRYEDELRAFPLRSVDPLEYCYENHSFESGDSEYLYSTVRRVRPRRILEIGSGHSTKMARNAILANVAEDASYSCRHVCIEPYELPWLEQLGIQVIRERVETLPLSLFEELDENDLLFIDSSHMIRPQGDELFEYLRILPRLRPGVIVHIHDIFTPRDYLREWIVDESRLWNEQYLLEAFLSQNAQFRIIGALNHLKHEFPELVARKLPILGTMMASREPGSFWMVRN